MTRFQDLPTLTAATEKQGAGSRGPGLRGSSFRALACGLLAVGLLAGCEEEARLPGDRLDPVAAIGGTPEVPLASGPRDVAVSLPRQVANADFPQRGGNAEHAPVHAALSAQPKLLWSTDIGSGVSKHHRILAQPVVGGGRIFTVDASAHVAAVSPAGKELWRTDVTGAGDRRGEAPASGLAYAGGKIFVTTAYAELVALDAATGQILWRQAFDSAIGGAPTVADGVVYVSTRASKGYAVSVDNGRVLWDVAGIPSPSGIAGVSAPAVSGDTVVFPFQSAGLMATGRDGKRRWMMPIAGRRLGLAYSNISAVTGDPVISGGTVFAGSSAGHAVAVDLSSGRQLWEADEGVYGGPMVVAGNALYASGDDGRLVRLDRNTGKTVWAVDLPYYVPKKKETKRRDVIVNYGPVLAGGRLFLVGTDGFLRAFDPASGHIDYSVEIPGGAASGPAVAGGTLYVTSKSGRLLAFR